jgi:hypothetical protein
VFDTTALRVDGAGEGAGHACGELSAGVGLVLTEREYSTRLTFLARGRLPKDGKGNGVNKLETLRKTSGE